MREEYDFSQGKVGPVIGSPGKTRITIMLDDDVLEFFRARAEAEGAGYQTLINRSLRAVMMAGAAGVRSEGLTLDDIRAVVREELNACK